MPKKSQSDISPNKSCILCGEDLFRMEKEVTRICDHCGQKGPVLHKCANSHFICETCLNMPVNDYIKHECMKYVGDDPIELAVKIMNAPVIKMHGPEHHFIVPAVLLTCVHNHRNSNNNLKAGLDLAAKRAEKETPRNCEFKKGTCGAAIGSGMFLNMLADRTAEMEDEWALDKELSARAIKAILDHPGPRCCKRDTYITLQEAVKFLKEKFEIELPKSEAKCTFSLRNKSCGLDECNFYNMSFSLV